MDLKANILRNANQKVEEIDLLICREIQANMSTIFFEVTSTRNSSANNNLRFVYSALTKIWTQKDYGHMVLVVDLSHQENTDITGFRWCSCFFRTFREWRTSVRWTLWRFYIANWTFRLSWIFKTLLTKLSYQPIK